MDAVGELVLLRALLSVLFGACLNVMLFWLKHFKAKKTPAHPLCLCTHGSGKFKYNFQQSGGGESDDDDDDECQVRRAVRTEYVLLLFVRAQICADCFGNVVQSQAVQLSRLKNFPFALRCRRP